MLDEVEKRKIFIGCSSEFLKSIELLDTTYTKSSNFHRNKFKEHLLFDLNNIFECEFFDETKWKDWKSIFDNLDNFRNEFYFAIFIYYPDDYIFSRGKGSFITRDNVIFELGYFLGALGKDKIKLLIPTMPISKEDSTKNLILNYQLKSMSDISGTMTKRYKINVFNDIDSLSSLSDSKYIVDYRNKFWETDFNSLLVEIKEINTEIKEIEKNLSLSKDKKDIENIANNLRSYLDKSEVEAINAFKNTLDLMIRTRSQFLNKSIKNILEDFLIFIEDFGDILDIKQLAVAQNHESVQEVWVYASEPLELHSANASEDIISLHKTVCSNLYRGCKYIYFIEHKYKDDIDNFLRYLKKTLLSDYALIETEAEELLKENLEFRLISQKYFLTYYTLHFDECDNIQQVYLSSLHKKRDKDILIQVNDEHKKRIYSIIKNLINIDEKKFKVKVLTLNDNGY